MENLLHNSKINKIKMVLIPIQFFFGSLKIFVYSFFSREGEKERERRGKRERSKSDIEDIPVPRISHQKSGTLKKSSKRSIFDKFLIIILQ